MNFLPDGFSYKLICFSAVSVIMLPGYGQSEAAFSGKEEKDRKDGEFTVLPEKWEKETVKSELNLRFFQENRKEGP